MVENNNFLFKNELLKIPSNSDIKKSPLHRLVLESGHWPMNFQIIILPSVFFRMNSFQKPFVKGFKEFF